MFIEFGKCRFVLFAGSVCAELPDAVGGEWMCSFDLLQEKRYFCEGAVFFSFALRQEGINIYAPNDIIGETEVKPHECSLCHADILTA